MFKDSACFTISLVAGALYLFILILVGLLWLVGLTFGPAAGGGFAAILLLAMIGGTIIIPFFVLAQLISLVVWLLKPVFKGDTKNETEKSKLNILEYILISISVIYPILHFFLPLRYFFR
jgi:hypothetical protein